MSDFLSVVAIVAFITMIVLGIRVARSTIDRTVKVTPRSLRGVFLAGVVWVGAFALSLVMWTPAAPVDPSAQTDGQPLMSVAGYTQTWPKGYFETTCAEYTDTMTSDQQFVAAADMLTLVWMKIEQASSYPSDTLIVQYQDELTAQCSYPDEKIVEVAWSIWIYDPRFSA